MDYSKFSMLAMVTAAVIYLFAVIAHAGEWAAARHARELWRRRPARQRILVGAGAAGLDPSTSSGTVGLDPSTGSGNVGLDPSTGSGDSSTSSGNVGLDPSTGSGDPSTGSGDEGVESAGDRLRTDLFGRIGIALAVVGLVAEIVGVVTRGIAADRLPWGNMYEFITASMVFLVATYLVLAVRFGMRWLGLPVMLLATTGLGLAVTVFYVDVAPLVPSLHSAWFLFHILAATVAAAAFTVGGVASVLFLLRTHAERKGEVHGYLAKLPSAQKIDRVAYASLAFAFPLFTFTIAAGAIWAQYAWGRYWNWDPKETWSLITWTIYAAYLHARATAGWKGRNAAIIAIIGMACFWWNFVGVNLVVSGLHSYAK